MLAFDAVRARELFDTISLPLIAPLTCADLMAPDMSLYYDVLRSVTERAFSASEIEKGSQERFIARRILAATSPLQVFPIAALLTDINIDNASRQRLLNLFASMLPGIHGDDRSFTISLLGEESAGRLRVLVRTCQTLGISPVSIIDGFRAFYSNHLASRRCSDTAESTPLRARQETAISTFNRLALEYLSNQPVIKWVNSTGNYDKAARATDLWQKSADYNRFVTRIAKVESMQAKSAGPSTAVDNELTDLVRSIDFWNKPEGLAPDEFFIIKSQLLARTARNAKSSGTYRLVAEAYAHLLEASVAVRDTSPALWLYCVTGALHSAEGEAPPRIDILQAAFEGSRDPVLNLYAGLTRRASAAKYRMTAIR